MPAQFRYVPPPVDAGLVMHGLIEAAETAGANALLEASQPLVPVESGDLKSSGHVERMDRGSAVVYSVESPDGYPYGIRQHEDETLNHPNGGQAHYLLDPMTTARDAILLAMLAELRF